MKKKSPYDRLLTEHRSRPEQLPVDTAVEKSKPVVQARKRVLTLLAKLRKKPTASGVIEFADAFSEYSRVGGNEFFDSGYRIGRLDGRTEVRRVEPSEVQLTRLLCGFALDANLPRHVTANAMLTAAGALVRDAAQPDKTRRRKKVRP